MEIEEIIKEYSFGLGIITLFIGCLIASIKAKDKYELIFNGFLNGLLITFIFWFVFLLLV